MLSEDALLLRRFKNGSRDALRCIYAKYENPMLTLATALLIDIGEAEDAVHDVFVKFAQSAERIRVNGNLKSYLATCTANRARDVIRKRYRQRSVGIDEAAEVTGGDANRPDVLAMCDEESRRLHRMLGRLPYGQREAVFLHVHQDMSFGQIAKIQGASVNTVKGRYRYGVRKLRTMLQGEAHYETGR